MNTAVSFVSRIMQRFGFLFVGALLTVNCRAQTFGPPADAVNADSTHHQPWWPVVNLDSRNSFIRRHHVSVKGGNIGVIVGPRRDQLTIGYYWLTYNSQQRLIDWNRKAAIRLNLAEYVKRDLWFCSLMYWRSMIATNKFIVSIPVELGAGQASAVPTNWQTGQPVGRQQRTFFVPVQVGVYGEWRASRWVGLNAQVGYRYTVVAFGLKEHYDGFYYSVGATFYPAPIKDGLNLLRHGPRNN